MFQLLKLGMFETMIHPQMNDNDCLSSNLL